jgi:hypothetical protein
MQTPSTRIHQNPFSSFISLRHEQRDMTFTYCSYVTHCAKGRDLHILLLCRTMCKGTWPSHIALMSYTAQRTVSYNLRIFWNFSLYVKFQENVRKHLATIGFCVYEIQQASHAYCVCFKVTAILDVMPCSLISMNISEECAAILSETLVPSTALHNIISHRSRSSY